MTHPTFVSGQNPGYTEQALKCAVQGTAVIRCGLTAEGRVVDCCVEQGLWYMDESTVRALETRRYRPVTLDGTPIEVDYTFSLTLKLGG